ncbi:MAG: Sec-independent protein translocase TatA [Planctomycetota bacterium]|nr:MAG: Sec-independent protein translocase TatA [Planctomycetota bacterium]REJ96143.1 MAG: Sec-independent protein translocase TatA [Planctomycetota bacterium]REK22732.1 MAG: Sec-independent protein translocase TatA [Planctomycetota bacterium]REK33848.1 MAG: Sec-independent protein translocase TatA [Planctomycetota bacterium]
MFGLSSPEMLMFGIIALLLFGKRLPEVARSLGKGMTEFKKGIRGVEDDMRSAYRDVEREVHRPRPDPAPNKDRELLTPKFEPPKTEPVATGTDEQS